MKEKIKKLMNRMHLTPKRLAVVTPIALLVILTITFLLIFLLGYERIPKDALVLVDANEKSSIADAGFQVDKKDSYRTKYSAKWSVDEKPDFVIENAPKDISQHDTLVFKAKLESTKQARVMFYFGSENADTEEVDFYSCTVSLKAGEWQEYSFDLSKLVVYGEPLGLENLTEISIRTTGWRNSAAKGSVVRFGHVYMTGEKLELDSIRVSTDALDEIPHFTQFAIDEAAELAANPTAWPQYDNGSDMYSYPAEKCTNALYYLTLAVRYNEMDEKADPLYASNGMLCKDAVIKLLEFFLEGGNEPMASCGANWGHAVMASSLVLIKNTDSIYNELSQDTKDRMDWMMRALAIAGNWGYNDANNYTTGLDLHGNFNKTWNMNFQNSYLSVVLNSSLYFGAKELDEMYVNFNYDTYMDKFREYNFINVIFAWETAGKSLMETGVTATGEDPVLDGIYGSSGDGGSIGDWAGSGKGVKLPFVYTMSTTGETITLQDEDFAQKLFTYLASKTYGKTVVSSIGNQKDEDFCQILGDVIRTEVNEENNEEIKVYSTRKSPFEGRIGMFSELNANDSHGIRSCLVYPYDSFQILTTVYTNMKILGDWDSSTQEMQALDEQIYVGNEDFIFRCEYGYRGYASGKSHIAYEWTYDYRGLLFIKDIWKNFHCDWDADVSIKKDPDTPEIVDLPDADPMGGVVKAPKGALAAQSLYNNTFVDASYTSFGQLSKGKVKFDIVVGNDAFSDENKKFDAVVAIMKKGTGKTWANMNMSIQLQDQLVNIRSGSSYARTGFQFESNYRFRAELEFDAVKKSYNATIYQIYPTVGEVYSCANIPFRTGSDLTNYVDSIAVMKQNKWSDMWLENVYVNDKLIAGTDVKYGTTEAVKVADTEAPVTKLRVHTKIWNEFVDYTKNRTINYVNRETVIIAAADKASELSDLQYCITTKALSENAVKKHTNWKQADKGVACFKLEPYKEYYVYVKSVDSEGNVAYVSNHIMLDPDIPVLKGIVTGKTYCEEQVLRVSDKFLSSVTINDEEIISKLSADGKYVLPKNSGKLYIVVSDRAGNTRKATIRVSDTVLTNKVIVDQNDKDTVSNAGFTVESNNTYDDAPYSAKWSVDNTYKNIKGATGDLSDYTKLHFSIKVVPKKSTPISKFMVYFGGKNTTAGKPQYYASYLTATPNQWCEYTIDLADMSKSRYPSWSAIEYFRIQACNWDDAANIEIGSTIYIGYMYLEAGDEDRVHAANPRYEYVPSITDTTKHDYKYTCCNTVVKSESHVKADNSDNCRICGQNMNTLPVITNGDKQWTTLQTSDGDKYYTNQKRIQVTAHDYGFGIKKLEYAVSSSYVENLNSLQWTTIGNTYTKELNTENETVYVYARVTDKFGKVTCISTNGIVYDTVAPVIKGITAGTTYCDPQTVTVKDVNINKVTVGNKTATLNSNNQFTLNDNCGTQNIVATDKAGNSTSMIVTVRDTLVADKVVTSNTSWRVTSKEKEFYFTDSASTKGVNLANYKYLSFKMKVTPATGTSATKVKLQMRLWSHTYCEYVVDVTPNQWQTVKIDLYKPDAVTRSMNLTNVRLLALIAQGGEANVANGSAIQIQNMRLCEDRIHANPIMKVYAASTTDGTKHHLKYECCNTIVKTEAHTYGQDGKCIYCTAPAIEGVKGGATYCVPPTITIRDNNALSYVKVNGEEVTLDTNNQYKIPNVNGTYEVEVMDVYANKTKTSFKVLNIELRETKTIATAFEYDFVSATKKYKNVSVANLGEILASYDTLKFTAAISSETLKVGTQVDFWIRLYVTNNDYYLYSQKVTVGQTNTIEMKLSKPTGSKNATSGYTLDIADVTSIWFQSDWGGSELKYCAVDVSDIILSGLHRERVHIFDQEVETDMYRVNMNEVASCANGLDYYKSCICGTKGTEIFEGNTIDVHASDEYIYKVNAENAKQHDVIHKCCGVTENTTSHSNSFLTQAGETTCEFCGITYFDYMDHTAPIIAGIEDGKIYYNQTPKMLVTDDWLDKVTVNGEEITVNTDASPISAVYTFKVSAEPYVIVATDYSGNQTTYTITVLTKKIWLQADFETTVDYTSLKGEGWTDESQSNGAQNSRFNIATVDESKVLIFTGNNTFSGSPRLMKEIVTTGYDNLTVEFAVKTMSLTPLQVGVNVDMTSRNVSLSPVFWKGGTSDKWVQVKLAFTFDGNNGTVNAFVKSDNEWVADNDYKNIGFVMTDGKLSLNFLAASVTKDTSVYLDNVVMYSISTEADKTTNSEPTVKRSLFTDDFESMATSADLLTSGWTSHSHGTAKNSNIYSSTKDGSNVLGLTGNNSFSGSPRVMKAIDVTGLENLTVEFDVKLMSDDRQLQVGGNTDMSTRSVTLNPVFWKGGSSEEWTTYKLVFAIDGNTVTSKAYKKTGDEWVADATYGDVSYTLTDNTINLNFYAYDVNNTSTIFVDNVDIYTMTHSETSGQ